MLIKIHKSHIGVEGCLRRARENIFCPGRRKVACDIFTVDNQDYLVTVGYFSNFWDVDHLSLSTSKTVIKKLKAHFARYGIPYMLVSDNEPQFSSDEFAEFSHHWEFKHITGSPRYLQSNGKAEQAVKMAKRLVERAVKSNSDSYLALLDFRNTSTQGIGTIQHNVS